MSLGVTLADGRTQTKLFHGTESGGAIDSYFWAQ